MRNRGPQPLTLSSETRARTAAVGRLSSRFSAEAAGEDSTGSLGGGVKNVTRVAMEG